MKVFFINAVLWPLAVLIAAPVLVHLFARTRPPVYLFSTVVFIRRAVRSTLRIKRPQDVLLLILRTLLVATLILLFLRPILFAGSRPINPFEKKNIAMVVDATASMGCSEGAQTRFALACAEASEMLKGISSRDSANIIWLRSECRAVFPEMGINAGFLQQELRKARVSWEAGNPDDAVRLAVEMLSETEGNREICIVSDFQATTWDGKCDGLPVDADVVKVKVGGKDVPNCALSDISFDPLSALVDEDVSVFCEVHNYSDTPMHRTVYLKVGETRQSRAVQVPAHGKAETVFRCRFSESGLIPVTASIDEDSFSQDDRGYAVLQIRDCIRAGVLAGEDDAGAGVWRRALSAFDWVRVSELGPEDLEEGLPLDVLFVSEWNGDGGLLRRIVSGGCMVVMAPAPQAEIEQVAEAAGVESVDPGRKFRWEELSTPIAVEVADEEHRVFEIFRSGSCGDPGGGRFRGRLVWDGNIPAPDSVILKYTDGVPALFEYGKGAGLYVWNIRLDPAMSDWAGRVEFLPFLGELLLLSRDNKGSSGTIVNIAAGGFPVWNPSAQIRPADVSLTGVRGESVACNAVHVSGGYRFEASEPPPPGTYCWRHKDKTVCCCVINFPVMESDLRTIEPELVKAGVGAVAESGGQARRMREGISLWSALLAALLGILILEGAVLLWSERR